MFSQLPSPPSSATPTTTLDGLRMDGLPIASSATSGGTRAGPETEMDTSDQDAASIPGTIRAPESQGDIIMADDSFQGGHDDDNANQPVPYAPRTFVHHVDCPLPLQLGNLHKRRASTSPQKCNNGRFEPLPLFISQPEAKYDTRPAKRARLENQISITYDSIGTPRVASVTPVVALPSGRTISGEFVLSAANVCTSDTGPFRLLKAILRDYDIFYRVVSFLDMHSLVTLYSTNRAFHKAFNRNYLSLLLASMRRWAPDADQIYPWRFYKDLCIQNPFVIKDYWWKGQPARLQKDRLPDIPSLRWLQMVVWRQRICKDILIQLATKGLLCISGTLDALKRVWFIMDLPLNPYRLAVCRNEIYLSRQAIYCLTMFFLKVDMAFTDPLGPVMPANTARTNTLRYPPQWEQRGGCGTDLTALLMGERHLTPLWRVLKGYSWDPSEPAWPMTRLDVVKLWIRHWYRLPAHVPQHVKRQSILGIPWYQVGTAGLERVSVSIWSLSRNPTGSDDSAAGAAAEAAAMETQRDNQQPFYPHRKYLFVPRRKPRERLLRPEELVLRESIRRGYQLHTEWFKMMLFGFCDNLGRPLPKRTEQELLDWSNGKPPLEYFRSNAEVLRERQQAGTVEKTPAKEPRKAGDTLPRKAVKKVAKKAAGKSARKK